MLVLVNGNLFSFITTTTATTLPSAAVAACVSGVIAWAPNARNTEWLQCSYFACEAINWSATNRVRSSHQLHHAKPAIQSESQTTNTNIHFFSFKLILCRIIITLIEQFFSLWGSDIAVIHTHFLNILLSQTLCLHTHTHKWARWRERSTRTHTRRRIEHTFCEAFASAECTHFIAGNETKNAKNNTMSI